MKIIGFFFVVASLSFLGIFISQKISEKIKNMKKSEEIITALINGTENGRHTFDEMLDEITKICTEEKALRLCGRFQNENLDDESELFSGNEETDKALENALRVFGTCFAKEQVRELNYYREIIRNEISKNEEAYLKNSKLAKSLGVLCGFLAAILLY